MTSASGFGDWSMAVITCDPRPWYDASDEVELPLVIYNVGKAFGRPGFEISGEYESGDYEDFYENIVFDCSNTAEAIKNIAENKLGTGAQRSAEFLNKISESDNIFSWKIQSVILDFSFPWGERGGVLSELLSQLPPALSRIRQLQAYPSLIISLLIARQCPEVEEIISFTPRGSLFQQPLVPYRNLIRNHIDLAAVLELPPGGLAPLTQIPSAVVIFQKKAAHSETLFYSISQTGELVQVNTQPWFRDFKASLSGEPPRHGFLAMVKPRESWVAQNHVPKTYGVPKGLAELCSLTRLDELFEIISGIHFPREVASGTGGEPVIRGRDIGKNRAMDTLERFVFKGSIPERARARKGDLLIQRIGASPSFTLVDENLVGAVVGDTVFILRPRSESVPVESVFQLMTSKAGSRLLALLSKGTITPTLTIKGLAEWTIPILPTEISQQLVTAAKAEEAIRQRADRLESIRHSVLIADSREEFEQQILALKTITEVFSSSIESSDDLNYKIRNFYPFPLAYSYRFLDSIVNPAELYREQLRVAENILAFLGSLTLALVGNDSSIAGINTKEAWRKGISAGHWLNLATKGASLLTEGKAGGLAVGLRSLWNKGKRETQFHTCISKLLTARNKLSHGQGPKIEPEFASASVEIATHLQVCMSALEVFIQFPIRLISNIDIDRRTHIPMLDTLKYVGDHPAHPQEKVRHRNPLPKGILFLDVGYGRWETLFPFVTVQYCPNCKTRETYFVDKWSDKKAHLLSFERGHEVESQDVAQELELKLEG